MHLYGLSSNESGRGSGYLTALWKGGEGIVRKLATFLHPFPVEDLVISQKFLLGFPAEICIMERREREGQKNDFSLDVGRGIELISPLSPGQGLFYGSSNAFSSSLGVW